VSKFGGKYMDHKKLIENLNKLLSKNNLYNILVVFLVGVLVLILANFFNSSSKETNATATTTKEDKVLITEEDFKNYEISKKSDLKSMLSKMKGVGQVEVMIAFEGGEELVPAMNINDGTNNTNEKDNQGGERENKQVNKGSQIVMSTKDGESVPVILKKYNPKIIGVMIVAEGAQDKQIQLDIKNAVGTLFAIQTNKVNVYPMK
jgi:stage III sporulation protein AG